MALTTLTDQQKQELINNQQYKELCKWALLDKARYWLGLDGSSVPGNDWVKWARSRFFGNQIIDNPFGVENDQSLPLSFAVLLTQDVYDNAGAFDVATVVEYMDDNQIFDTLADLYFDQKVKSIQF